MTCMRMMHFTSYSKFARHTAGTWYICTVYFILACAACTYISATAAANSWKQRDNCSGQWNAGSTQSPLYDPGLPLTLALDYDVPRSNRQAGSTQLRYPRIMYTHAGISLPPGHSTSNNTLIQH